MSNPFMEAPQRASVPAASADEQNPFSYINFFEQELRKLFGDGRVFDNPKFVGRMCLADLSNDLRARVEFVSTEIHDKYDALKISILNRTSGPVDVATLRLVDLIGPKEKGVLKNISPHIYVANDRSASWWSYEPTPADFEAFQDAVATYTDVFRSTERERAHDSFENILADAAKRSGRS